MSPKFRQVHGSVANYRPISITSVLSKVFERLVSVRFGRFMKRSDVLLTTQFAYRKGLGTSDTLLCVFHTLQSALESGQEARIVQYCSAVWCSAADTHLKLLDRAVQWCPVFNWGCI